MTSIEEHIANGKILRRPTGNLMIPREGEDGLFTQSWFPICLSSDVPAGKVVSKSFLDGNVIVFRGEDGTARVMSAYCLHMGANLADGDVVGNEIRCPFHHWSYDGTGQCMRTGIGDKPPSAAKLFAFPTEEQFGIIFAFNGETPLHPFPDLLEGADCTPDDLLVVTVEDPRCPWPLDPWSIRGNTPDWAHFVFVHNMAIDLDNVPNPKDAYQFEEQCVKFSATVNLGSGPAHEAAALEYNTQITGTTLWHNHGQINGKWNMMLSALGIPKKGQSSHFFVIAVHKGSGSEEELAEANQFLTESRDMWERMLDEDDHFMKNQSYLPGLMTKADTAVARFLQYVKAYPRAHPAYQYMR